MLLNQLLIFLEQKAISYHKEKQAVQLLMQFWCQKHLNKNLLLSLRITLKKKQQNQLEQFVNQYIEKNIPIAYLTKQSYFLNHKFFINEHVLIPRPETEELVEKTFVYIKKYFQKDNIDILELGAGSGCITFSLANNFPRSKLVSSDVCSKALQVAFKNNDCFKERITFIQSNWFSNINQSFDVIITNPPYVSKEENLDALVLKEPYKALFAKDKLGVSSYKAIFEQIKMFLKEKSLICLEHGYKQQEEIEKIIKKYLPQALIFKEQDLSQRKRFIFVLYQKEKNDNNK